MTKNNISPTNRPNEPKRQDVHVMFDRISGRYDLLNRLLSMRRDVAWRKKMTMLTKQLPSIELLDIATGTGDVLLTFASRTKVFKAGVGLDMSAKMLELASEKCKNHPQREQLALVRSDACRLPFKDDSFNLTTISFGIRNVTDVPLALREMYRVLQPGGKVMILEFSLPENRLMRSIYLWYFRKVLPKVGALISGDSYAYKYLNQTVETFPHGEAFCTLLREAGFKEVHDERLTFGIASIYTGEKDNS